MVRVATVLPAALVVAASLAGLPAQAQVHSEFPALTRPFTCESFSRPSSRHWRS